jgi:hypothetical protein
MSINKSEITIIYLIMLHIERKILLLIRGHYFFFLALKMKIKKKEQKKCLVYFFIKSPIIKKNLNILSIVCLLQSI